MKGLSRIGFGIAAISLGATILFGSPRIAAWDSFPWEWVALPVIAVGAGLLIVGSIAAVDSRRKFEAARAEERVAGIEAARIELVAARALIAKLSHWRDVADDYEDELRRGQLDADLESARGDERAALRRLSGYGIKGEQS